MSLIRGMDDLDTLAFQAMANDVLAAEYNLRGVWRAFNLGYGVKDGGWDAEYSGPFRGHEGTWRVSIKKLNHPSDKPMSALEANLKKEVKEHRGEACLVVTNANLKKADKDQFLIWLRGWSDARSDLIGRSELEQWLRSHPHVARSYKLASYDNSIVFRSPGRASPLRDAEATLPEHERAALQILTELDRGAPGVDLVGQKGAGQDEVLRLLSTWWWQGRTGSDRQTLLVMSGSASPTALETAWFELDSSGRSFLILVPPVLHEEVLPRLLELVRDSPGPEGRPHRLVLSLTPVEQRKLTPSRICLAPPRRAVVKMDLPEAEVLRMWLSARGNTSDAVALARAAHVTKSRPGWARDWLMGGEDTLAAQLGSALRRATGQDVKLMAAALRLVLILPAPVPGTKDGLRLRDLLARQSGLDVVDVDELIEGLIRNELIAEERTGLSEAHDTWPRLILPALPADEASADRLWRDLVEIDKLELPGDESATGRAARRLARAGLEEVPRLWIDGTRQTIQMGTGSEVADGLSQLSEIGGASPDLATRSMPLVHDAIVRLERGETFPRPAPSPDLPPEWAEEQAIREQQRAPTQVANAILHALQDLGYWPEVLGVAAELLARVARVSGLELKEQDVVAVAGKLSDPVRPGLEGSTRIELVLPPFIDALQGTSGAEAVLLARLIRKAATLWLGSSVEKSTSVGRTFFWAFAGWNESYPRLSSARDAAWNALVGLLKHSVLEARLEGWGGLGGIGAGERWDESASAPDGVRQLQVRTVNLLSERLPQVVAWDERLAVEALLLWAVERRWAEPSELRQAALKLPQDANYLAWTVLSGQPAILDRNALADVIQRGDVDQLQERLHSFEDEPSPGEVVLIGRLVAEDWAPAALIQLLRRVDQTLQSRKLVVRGRSNLLARWAAASPELFRTLLSASHWQEIPRDIRPHFVESVGSQFHAEVARLLEGTVVSGRALGSAATLAELIARPEQASTTELHELLDLLDASWEWLPDVQPVLVAQSLARYPDAQIRFRVAQLVGLTMGVRFRELDAAVLAGITRTLCEGEVGLGLAWSLAGHHRWKLPEAVLDEIGAALLADLAVRGAWRTPSGSRDLGALLTRPAQRDEALWRSALRGIATASFAPLSIFDGLKATKALVLSARQELRRCEDQDRARRVFEAVVQTLPPTESFELADELGIGDPDDPPGASWVLGAIRISSPEDGATLDRFAAALVSLAGSLDAGELEQLMDRMYLNNVTGFWSPGPRTRDRLERLADAIERACRTHRGPSVADPGAIDQLIENLRREAS